MSSALSSLSSSFVASSSFSTSLAPQSSRVGGFIFESVKTCTPFDEKLSKIILDYLVGPSMPVIGSKELEKIWGIKTEEVELGIEFYNWWVSPDAHDQMLAKENSDHIIRLNSETHYTPVFRDRFVTNIDTNTREALSLGKVGHLAEKPKAGYHRSRYDCRTEALRQNKKKEAAGPGCYLCMRKEGIGRGMSLSEQIKLIQKLNAEFGADYEEENSALDVAFVALAIHALTGMRPLSDSTDEEGRYTVSRCSKDTVEYEGNETPYWVVVGGFTPLVVDELSLRYGGLRVDDDDFFHDYIVISCLRKFSDHR